MRPNTQIHIAVRNIGDSQDLGDFYVGTLSDSIIWLATKMSTTTMATRIVIGIGRNHEDAARGIEVANAGRSAVSADMHARLRAIFDGDSDELEPSQPASESDDYVP